MELHHNQPPFFALLRAGLWENEIRLSQYRDISFEEIYRYAQEQSIIGLIAAGLEHVEDVVVPKQVLLLYAGSALQLEQRNIAMNCFIAEFIESMRKADIYSVLIKGQGIAQCYERPLWRACGDIDLLLSESNYEKAKILLTSVSDSFEDEVKRRKHIGFSIRGWIVELHGSLRGNVLRRIDVGMDKVYGAIFYEGNVRSWKDDHTIVFLPAPDEDVVLVFSHILQHFTQGGIGLRQICDWCRLLWTYRDTINVSHLERRLQGMRLISEWKAFAALAINFLGMPSYAMPLYSASGKWKRKANRIVRFVMKTGNMGNLRDTSYYSRHSYIVSKMISFWRHTTDAVAQFFIFPLDSLLIWFHGFVSGLKRL